MWVVATLIGALAQTGRNAAQSGLTTRIGTVGATAVRFVFGLPFALLALVVAALFLDIPHLNPTAIGLATLGAAAQIFATAFMLITMRGQSFGVATALMKTEPVTLAIFGASFLAEPLGLDRMGAIGIATLGVILASGARWSRTTMTPVLTGLVAGALFGLSAIGFRGAILALPEGGFFIRSLTALTLTLAIQAFAMLLWMAWRDKQGLRGMVEDWKISLLAGALGSFASLFWFIGFSLTSAANVRTLALVEVVFAQIMSGRFLREKVQPIQLVGMALIIAGVCWLLAVAV